MTNNKRLIDRVFRTLPLIFFIILFLLVLGLGLWIEVEGSKKPNFSITKQECYNETIPIPFNVGEELFGNEVSIFYKGNDTICFNFTIEKVIEYPAPYRITFGDEIRGWTTEIKKTNFEECFNFTYETREVCEDLEFDFLQMGCSLVCDSENHNLCITSCYWEPLNKKDLSLSWLNNNCELEVIENIVNKPELQAIGYPTNLYECLEGDINYCMYKCGNYKVEVY